MHIIGIVARKGGVGKTTLTINFAELVARTGARVAVLDIDLQGSAGGWRKRQVKLGAEKARKAVVVVRSSEEELQDHLDLCESSGIDWVFIDTRPDIDSLTKAVCVAADYAVVPTRPSIMDLESIAWTVALLKRVSTPSCVILSAAPAVGKETREARAMLQGTDWDLVPTNIIDRVAYRRAAAAGTMAGDLDRKAKREVINAWAYISKQVEAAA